MDEAYRDYCVKMLAFLEEARERGVVCHCLQCGHERAAGGFRSEVDEYGRYAWEWPSPSTIGAIGCVGCGFVLSVKTCGASISVECNSCDKIIHIFEADDISRYDEDGGSVKITKYVDPQGEMTLRCSDCKCGFIYINRVTEGDEPLLLDDETRDLCLKIYDQRVTKIIEQMRMLGMIGVEDDEFIMEEDEDYNEDDE